MQNDETITLALLDEVVSTLERVVKDLNNRIDQLEADTPGVPILDEIDPERTDYRRNQLARHKGGLHQFDGQAWHCIVDAIDRVAVENGDGKAKLVFAKSSGAIIEREIAFARPGRKKAA